jgi:hypothetical protein
MDRCRPFGLGTWVGARVAIPTVALSSAQALQHCGSVIAYHRQGGRHRPAPAEARGACHFGYGWRACGGDLGRYRRRTYSTVLPQFGIVIPYHLLWLDCALNSWT